MWDLLFEISNSALQPHYLHVSFYHQLHSQMRLKVSRLRHGVKEVYAFNAVPAAEKVRDFKLRVAHVTSVPAALQRLAYDERQLKDDETLLSNGVCFHDDDDDDDDDSAVELSMTAFDFTNEAMRLLPTILAMMVCATFYNAINETFDGIGLSTNPSSTALGSFVIALLVYILVVAATSCVLGFKKVPSRAEATLLTPLGLVAGAFFSKAMMNVRTKLLQSYSDAPLEKWALNAAFLASVLVCALALSVWSATVERLQLEARNAEHEEQKKRALRARVAFKHIDANHSGNLTEGELSAAFVEATGEAASPSVVRGMIRDVGSLEGGLISQDAFVSFVEKTTTPTRMLTKSSSSLSALAAAASRANEVEFSPFKLAVAKINNSFVAVTVGRSASEVLNDLFYNSSAGIWGAIAYAICVNKFAASCYNALRVWSSHEAKEAAGEESSSSSSSSSSSREDRSRLVDAEIEALVRTKNIFLVKMSLIMTVRFSYWTVLTKLDKLGDHAALQLGWDVVIMAALSLLVSWTAWFGQEIDLALHDFEGTPPQCATFLPGDLLRSAGLLAAQTVPMSFGSICFVLMQDPIMAISFLPLRILVLWVVAGGLAAFMLRQIGKQREQILAEFQKEVKTVSALNSIRRNLMRILKKRGRRCGGSSNNGGTAGGNPGSSKNEKTALLEV